MDLLDPTLTRTYLQSQCIAYDMAWMAAGRGCLWAGVQGAAGGGVQDVAVKQLSHTGDGQLQKFIEVGIH